MSRLPPAPAALATIALLIPYVALGETLLYFDLQARAETEPVERLGLAA